MATSKEVRMPRLAPAPMSLDAHSQPANCWKAVEKGAPASICWTPNAASNLDADQWLSQKSQNWKLQKKLSKFVPGRVVERPYHVVRLEHAECEGDEAVENCDEDDGSRDSDGHVLGRVLHLLRSCGNSVIPNIAEVHDRCSVEDSSHPEWCEAGGADRGLHCSRGNSCRNIR